MKTAAQEKEQLSHQAQKIQTDVRQMVRHFFVYDIPLIMIVLNFHSVDWQVLKLVFFLNRKRNM